MARIDLLNPASRVFKTTLEEATKRDFVGERSKLALNWYMNRIKMMSRDVSPESVRRLRSRYRKNAMWGRMYFFKYDPKGKDDLPYYDAFPFTLIVEKKNDGFTGLNFHYLPYIARAELLDGLMSITNNNQYDDSTKILTTYQFLKQTTKLKLFRPCFKRYLYTHVKSPFIRVESVEWPVAFFLPVEDFRKQSKTKIWKTSIMDT
jgi:hypothetical protein